MISDAAHQPELTAVDVNLLLGERALSWQMLMVAFVLSLALIADGFDLVVVAYLAPDIASAFGMTQLEIGTFFTFCQLSMFAGSIVGGVVGDRLGRKLTLTGSILGFGAGTLLCGVSEGEWLFIAARLFAHFCLGSVAPNVATYLIEVLPRRWTSRISILAYASVAVGGTLCGIIIKMLVPDYGWRAMLIIGGIAPMCIVPLMLAFLPETPRFLIRTGRPVFQVARSLHRLTGESFQHIGAFTVSEQGAAVVAGNRFQALIRDHRAVLVVLSLFAFLLSIGVVGMTSMGALILTAVGLTPQQAVSAMLAQSIASFAGAIVAATLIDRVGSKAMLLLLLTCSGSSLATLAVVTIGGVPLDPELAVILFATMGFGLNSALMVLFPLAAQSFPILVRATGTGLATSVGKIGSVVSGIGVAILLARYGASGTFAGLGVAIAGSAVTILFFRRHILAERVRGASKAGDAPTAGVAARSPGG